MAKYSGMVGYVEKQIETRPGKWEDVIIERHYTGDIHIAQERWQSSSKVHEDFNVDNKISIVGDPYAIANFAFIRYVIWQGVKWKVQSITVERPRLNIYLGGIYHGE